MTNRRGYTDTGQGEDPRQRAAQGRELSIDGQTKSPHTESTPPPSVRITEMDDRMQLTDYVAQRGIKVRILDGPETYFETHQGREYKRFRFRVQLRLDGRTVNVRDYTQGELSNPEGGDKVDAADVLHCLLTDASFGEYDFREFCAESGFDPEVEPYAARRQMERTWRACQREAQRLPRFLGGDDEYDTARNAEH